MERHHVGYAIRLDGYECQVLAPNSRVELEAGMLFEIEVPVYHIGFGTAFIEDTVEITAQGARLLTRLPRELASLSA